MIDLLAGNSSIGHVELLKNKLVSRYRNKQWSTSISSGKRLELFIRLALVKKAKMNENDKATNQFLRNSLHGLVDDILQRKELIEVENLFSKRKGDVERLLVEGAPGIGKTMLAQYVSRKWADGELLKEYDLVIFVQLRRLQVLHRDGDINIQDLVTLYLSGDKGRKVAEELAYNGCKDTLLILDGWDELAPNLRCEFSYLHDIVSGNSADFENASVMVTSRITVSSTLRTYVDKHVEILGFDTKQVQEYVSSCIPQQKAEVVFSHFKKFPNIQALSHIPFILSIICSVLRDSNSLPPTLTPLYDLYIRKIIVTNLNKCGEYDKLTGLSSLKELPPQAMEVVQSLSKLAWKGLLEECLVFTKSDLEYVGVSIESSAAFDAFGLLTSFCYDDGAGQTHYYKVYQFCHLTVQEYLAAFYLSELDHKIVLDLLEKHRLNPKFREVWKFFSGLTKLSEVYSYVRNAIISKTRITNNKDVVFLLHCVYEANDPSVCLAAAAHLQRELHLDNLSLNPTDCLCLAYTLAHAGGKWIVNMRGCNIGSSGLDVLYANLQWQQESSCASSLSFSRFE